MMKKGLKFKIGLGVVLLALLLAAGPAFGEAMSMLSFVDTNGGANPEAGSITFTSYYDNDAKIHTEDSWNDENSNTGYVDSAGSCRVSPVQMGGDQTGSTYHIWVSYTGTEGNQGGTASLTVPGSGIGYTLPNPLALSASNFLATPTGFKASVGDGQALFEWNQVSGAADYRVYKRPAAGEGPTEIVFERVGIATGASNTKLLVTGLTNGTTYYAIMVATASGKRSGHPNEIPVTPSATGAPNITTTSLPNGTQGIAYNQSVSASGGTAPYTWVIASGSLPAGLSLNPSTGAISGTPSTPGTSNFTIVVKDAGSKIDSQALSITVDPSGTTLNITTTSLPGGTVGVAYNQTVTATGGTPPYTWSISAGSLPNGLAINTTTGAITGTPTVANTFNFTVRVQDSVAASDTQALSITIGTVPPTDPDITLITPATAEIGQTLVIDGANFGATQGTSVVRFGTTMGNPTSWSDDQIIVAVPSTGISTGDVTVTIDVGGTTDSENITILGEKIYVDDFEGGAVNCFTPTAVSLYYVFDNVEDITPNNTNINDDLRSTEEAHERNYSAKVRYSFVGTDGSDYGGGWGAKLANTLDLDAIYAVDIFIKWDGTSNYITLNFKDGGETVNEAEISNSVLAALGSGGGVVRLYKSNFSVADDGDDGVFDWTDVAGYNLVYKGTATTTQYHYLDALSAVLGTTGGPEINTIIPAAGPAGTQITVSGIGFGDNQSLSMLIFDNTTTGASYQAEILSWREDQIVAIVPRLAEKGAYEVRVIKIAIVAGSTTAQESNTADFRVTAGGATEGGLATIYPNPFNPIAEQTGQPNASAIKAVTIAYDPGSASNVGIYIYDMTARLVYKQVTSGSQVTWNGYDTHNNLVGDGAYILRVIDEDSKRVIAKGKILVIKQ